MATTLSAAKVWIQISVSKISEVACGPPSGVGQNCKNIQNAVLADCTAAGVCQVQECAPGFHPSPDRKSCVQNTDEKCALPNNTNATSCSSGWDCSHGVCRKLTASKIYCNNNESTSINCLDTDIYQPICVPNGNAYSCGYACNDTQRECGSGGDSAPNRCITIINGLTCDDCAVCTAGQTCYRDGISVKCRDNLFPIP